ncbi:MAG TPA: tripartite tricarboxylate transporter substrate binding protein [Burkholderiaceae bacterium]|nr:tripartite tricarboxylate transporter substrate binding protein [Burkholderiaceae bacterium]
MTTRRRFVRTTVALAAAAGLPAPARSQSPAWPGKPLRVVVTFPPGGSSDIVARLIAPGLSERLGQPVVVENRPGAGATIGAAEVARAAPDGYTFMLSNTAPISLSPFMLDKSPYDPVAGFTHIGYIGSVPNAFVVHPSVPAKTLPEFVAWAKQQKDPINYGSGGVGSIGHIVGQLLEGQAGIRLTHVGYKGSSPMHSDLVGGTILFAVDTLPQNLPFMKTGRLRLLAVTSPKRSPMAQELPTVIEAGYPKLVAENFFGLSAPAGLPRTIVDAMHRHLTAALKEPKVIRTLEDDGIAMRPMSVEEFQAFVARQVAEWAPAVKASGARLG